MCWFPLYPLLVGWLTSYVSADSLSLKGGCGENHGRTVSKALCKLVVGNQILLGERGRVSVVNVGLALLDVFSTLFLPGFSMNSEQLRAKFPQVKPSVNLGTGNIREQDRGVAADGSVAAPRALRPDLAVVAI